MAMVTGRVIRFDEVKGYGFIAPSDGSEDVFVHTNDLIDRSLRVSVGSYVEFGVMDSDRGRKAYDVRVIDDLAPDGSPPGVRSGPAGNGGQARAQAGSDADEELIEVLLERDFIHQITELLLAAAPQLSGATVVELRSHFLQFARKNGWVE